MIAEPGRGARIKHPSHALQVVSQTREYGRLNAERTRSDTRTVTTIIRFAGSVEAWYRRQRAGPSLQYLAPWRNRLLTYQPWK